MSKINFVQNENSPHLGGNILEGDPATFTPTVWNYCIQRFAINSVLDLGSGMGYASQYFNNKGMKVLAVDGMIENCQKAIYPTIHLDLTKNKVVAKVDLVHCQEVVEHIEEKFIDNLLSSMTCGKFILMTNALPGQGGYHHVNEQPTEYWINKLKKYNCEVLVEDSKRIRKMAASDGAGFMAQTGLLLVNREFFSN
jgi:hypothetical protein